MASTLDTSAGEAPVPADGDELVVHLTAEYWPYARTGGLAEAVRGIARSQAAAGFRSLALLPLYKAVRRALPELEPCGEPFPVRVADRVETARVLRPRANTPQDPEVLFIENEGYFGRDGIYGDDRGDFGDSHLRFAFFCMAALTLLPRIASRTTILHAHDWHTALAAVYLRTLFAGQPLYDSVATVLTVHNAAFQDHLGPEALHPLGLPPSIFHSEALEWYGRVNVLKGGLVFSDLVTTVSPTHAQELRTPMGGFGLDASFSALQDRLVGIRNGIDYELWDPAKDAGIAARYQAGDLGGKAACRAWLQRDVGLSSRSDVPLVVMIARLAQQKGLDLLLGSRIVQDFDAQWIFLGEGERRYRDGLEALAKECPGKVAAFFEFTDAREHQLVAGADLLLMPSLYEPCGLSQLRAQRYGAIPLVRRVGGLRDTVEDGVTGFVFDDYHPAALADALARALEAYRDGPRWKRLVREAMARDFSWGGSVAAYRDVYGRAVARRRALGAAGPGRG